MISARTLCTFALLSTGAFAQTITFGTLTVPAISSTGTGFTYSGTLTQAATIALTVTGAACEQAGGVYCTNGAGVVTVAGSSPVGATTSFSGSIGGFSGTWNYGALIMTISGVGSVQIFPANAGNGLGTGNPPSTFISATTLSALGFGSFSVANPTITFTVADNNYGDNSGSFSVASSGATGRPTPLPAPGTLVLVILGMAVVTIGWWIERSRRSRLH